VRKFILALWIGVLVIGGLWIARTPFKADMSMFLPQHPTAEQQLLLDNLAAGTAGRLLLVAVQGVAPAQRASFAQAFATQLRAQAPLAWVNDGSAAAMQADQAYVFQHRYVLSDRLSEKSFTPAALRASIDASILDLSSATGLLTKQLLTTDPTGETLALADRISGAGTLHYQDGVWMTADGKSMLFVCHTRASGADLDGQALALTAVQQSFKASTAMLGGGASQAVLQLTGPGVFATESRDSIRNDVSRLSAIGTGLILLTLAIALRSARSMALVIVPMLTSVVVATATIAVLYGSVHGMVLGFGTTLIGEAVDYALYFLLATGPAANFWRAIRLGAAISVLGFAALLFAGFPGLEQLAVFSLAGLITAVITTRWVLPALSPQDTSDYQQRFGAMDGGLHRLAARLGKFKWFSLVPVALAAFFVWQGRAQLLSNDLAALNPVSAGAAQLDQRLRDATGSPDVRALIAVQGISEQFVLEQIEALTPTLDALVAKGTIRGYESPAAWLPSIKTQKLRQGQLPAAQTLRENLGMALAANGETASAPIKPARLEPFVMAVNAAREAPPLTRDSLKNTQLGLLIESLLYTSPGAKQTVNGLVSLRLPEAGSVATVQTIRQALAGKAYVLDLKQEADAMYSGYLKQTALMAALGSLAIVLLLWFSTRSLLATLHIVWPLLLALVLTCAWFIWRGTALTLLHQMGLFLMMAVGSNYSLFCWLATRPAANNASSSNSPSTPVAQLLACTTTVIGFGVLAASSVPLLSALGGTVGLGAALSLFLSWMWIGTQPSTHART
jgi:predicted exporter